MTHSVSVCAWVVAMSEKYVLRVACLICKGNMYGMSLSIEITHFQDANARL